MSDRLGLPELGLFPYFDFRSHSEQAMLHEPAWASTIAFADDLLGQAYHLANKEDTPKQASLRRAVSTGTLRSFHLLIDPKLSASGRQRSAVDRYLQTYNKGDALATAMLHSTGHAPKQSVR
jgi:hypothetical protein